MKNKELQEKDDLILVIGEVLYDIFPGFRRAGGAPFNFAFHLVQSGWAVKFITRVGADEDGRSLQELMRRSGFDLSYVQVDENRRTGRVMVYPDQNGGHSFDILKDAAYDYITFNTEVEKLLRIPPKLIYFGTLVQRTAEGRRTVERLCRSRPPQTILFYDINLRPGCYSRKIIRQSLTYADILKLNGEELGVLSEMFGLAGDTAARVKTLMRKFNLTMAALTKGDRGSELFTLEEHIEMPLERDYACVDTVGAGDAFAAILAAGYLKKRGLRETLAAASDFAGRICGIPGALPEQTDFYRSLKI